MSKAGGTVPYHSPHKFRHRTAVFGLHRSDNLADMKAVNQNLMHSDLKLTDRMIYSILADNDVEKRIANMG